MPWYYGSPLLRHMEELFIGNDRDLSDPRFPVQYVIRPYSEAHHDFRGFAGQIAGGVFRVGDPVVVLPSGRRSRISAIHTYDGNVDAAYTPMSVTLLLEDDIDISRGDMIVKPDNMPYVTNEFDATVCWMSEQPLHAGMKLGIKQNTRSARAVVKSLNSRINIDTLEVESPVANLVLNDIGRISIKTSAPLAFDAYRRNRYTGSFILIDEASNNTLAAGMIMEPKKSAPLPEFEGYMI
jgi:bifunctional enzyme CysN/CysC